MSYAREMLEAAPATAYLDATDLVAAIDACSDAEQACTSCADSSVAEDDVAALRRCIGLDQDCADVCGATARVLSRQLRYDTVLIHHLLQTCVRACASCA